MEGTYTWRRYTHGGDIHTEHTHVSVYSSAQREKTTLIDIRGCRDLAVRRSSSSAEPS